MAAASPALGRSHDRDASSAGAVVPKLSVKLLTLGSYQVGKTSLILRRSRNEFYEDLESTIGFQYATTNIRSGPWFIRARLWDTVGQERFRTLTMGLLRGTDGIIVVYSVIDRESFRVCRRWLRDVHEMIGEKPAVLVANKCDLERDEHQVTREEGEALAEALSIPFFETSAKTDMNVTDVVDTIAVMAAKQQHPSGPTGSVVDLSEGATASSDGGCCGR